MRPVRWALTFVTVLACAVVLYAQNPVSIAQLGTGTAVTTTLPVSGSLTAVQGTGSNLHVVVDTAPTTAVTGTFWQATQPVSGTVTANMGTVTADPFGANADAASATGSISAKLRFIASTGIPITGTVTVGSHAVTVASGGIASGAVASGAVASGAYASGSIGSGAIASGAIASGAVASGAYGSDSGSFGVGATGSAPPAKAVFNGGIGSGATGGFLVGIAVGDTQKPISITSGTTTLLVTGVSGRHVRITHLDLVTAVANNVALISGTGATCGTGTAGITGGTTAANGYNFAANGGLAMGSGVGIVAMTQATGDSVCVVTSSAGPLAGSITYAIY